MNEITIALILAALFAIPAYFFGEILKSFLYKLKKKFWNYVSEKRYRESIVHENAIIINNCLIPKRQIINAISTRNAMKNAENFHYQDISGNFHANRRLELLRMLDGNSFLREICESVYSHINYSNVAHIIYLKKKSAQEQNTNDLFAKEFLRNLPQKIKISPVYYDEKKIWFKKKIKTEIQKTNRVDSLQDTEVILLEALLLFPESLKKTIQWIKNQNAVLKNVVILFDGTSKNESEFSKFYGIKSEDIIKGCSIDLRLKENCNCNLKTKTLRYKDY